jgi:hypothetical protein
MTKVRRMRQFALAWTLPRHVIVAALIIAVCSPGIAFQMQPPDPGLGGKPQNGNAVTHWNRIASEIFPIEPGPIIDSRDFAILHAAIHDALNNIDRRYEPYTLDLPFLDASADAAVARAANDVLAELAPSHRERIDREFAAALRTVPDGPSKIAGLIVGELAARANLDRRSRDGVVPGPWPPQTGPITVPVYVPTGAPGDYDFTPPFDAPPLGPVALFPGWGRLTPFAIDLERHRLKGPDPSIAAATPATSTSSNPSAALRASLARATRRRRPSSGSKKTGPCGIRSLAPSSSSADSIHGGPPTCSPC